MHTQRGNIGYKNEVRTTVPPITHPIVNGINPYTLVSINRKPSGVKIIGVRAIVIAGPVEIGLDDTATATYGDIKVGYGIRLPSVKANPGGDNPVVSGGDESLSECPIGIGINLWCAPHKRSCQGHC